MKLKEIKSWLRTPLISEMSTNFKVYLVVFIGVLAIIAIFSIPVAAGICAVMILFALFGKYPFGRPDD